jgi:hypothetical protein
MGILDAIEKFIDDCTGAAETMVGGLTFSNGPRQKNQV